MSYSRDIFPRENERVLRTFKIPKVEQCRKGGTELNIDEEEAFQNIWNRNNSTLMVEKNLNENVWR